MRRSSAIVRRVEALNARELALSKNNPTLSLPQPISFDDYIDYVRDRGDPYLRLSTETADNFAHRASDRMERFIKRDEKDVTTWEDRATSRIIGLCTATQEARENLLGQVERRSVATSTWRERTVNGLRYWMSWIGIKVARHSSPLEYFSRSQWQDPKNRAFPRLSADRNDVNDVDHWRRRLMRLSNKRPVRVASGQRRITAYVKPSGRLTRKKFTRMGTLSCAFDWDGDEYEDVDLEATMDREGEVAQKPVVRRRSTVQLRITDFYQSGNEAMEEGTV